MDTTSRKGFLLLALVVSSFAISPVAGAKEPDGGCGSLCVAGGAIVGGAALYLAAPAVLPMIGFGATGITKGSAAAWAMSAAAKTGMGGAAVGTAQSIAAAGAGATTALIGAFTGGHVAYTMGNNACGQKKRGCN